MTHEELIKHGDPNEESDWLDAQHEQDENPVYCPMCDSGDSSVIGTMGRFTYFRCRACGWDYHD